MIQGKEIELGKLNIITGHHDMGKTDFLKSCGGKFYEACSSTLYYSSRIFMEHKREILNSDHAHVKLQNPEILLSHEQIKELAELVVKRFGRNLQTTIETQSSWLFDWIRFFIRQLDLQEDPDFRVFTVIPGDVYLNFISSEGFYMDWFPEEAFPDEVLSKLVGWHT